MSRRSSSHMTSTLRPACRSSRPRVEKHIDGARKVALKSQRSLRCRDLPPQLSPSSLENQGRNIATAHLFHTARVLGRAMSLGHSRSDPAFTGFLNDFPGAVSPSLDKALTRKSIATHKVEGCFHTAIEVLSVQSYERRRRPIGLIEGTEVLVFLKKTKPICHRGARDGDTSLVENEFSANIRFEFVEQLGHEHVVLLYLCDLAKYI